MPAKITTAIPKQKFDLVGVQIGEILTVELAAQAVLQPAEDINPAIFYERTTAINIEEVPVLNVSFAAVNFSNQHMAHADGAAIYNVDVYTRADNTDAARADKLASDQLKQILGICRYILSHPAYKTLDFAPGFIRSVQVQSISIQDPGMQDAKAAQMGRLVLSVDLAESTGFQNAVPLTLSTTNVKLHETDLGYKYELITNTDDSSTPAS